MFSTISNAWRTVNPFALVITLGWTILLSNPAAQGLRWSSTYGGAQNDQAYWIDAVGDSGFIVCGMTQSFGASGDDIYLLRVTSEGDTLWSRTYGGSGDDRGYCVRVTGDGGFVVAGVTEVEGHPRPCLVKTDSQGDTSWTTVYGQIYAPGYGGLKAVGEVIQCSDDGYAVVGTRGSDDIFLLRTDSKGDTLWLRYYESQYVGGFTSGRCVVEESDGSFLICGFQAGEACVVKFDSTGDTLWCRRYYMGAVDNRGMAMCRAPDQEFMIAGYVSQMIPSWETGSTIKWIQDFWVMRIDSAGDTVWTKRWATEDWAASGQQRAYAITPTDEGNFLMAGYDNLHGEAFVMAMNDTGDSLWTQACGGSVARSLQATHQGTIVGAGYSRDDDDDVYLFEIASESSTKQGEYAGEHPTGGGGMPAGPADILVSTSSEGSSIVLQFAPVCSDMTTISLLDPRGRCVYRIRPDAKTGTGGIYLHTGHLPNGSYTLLIKSPERFSRRRVLIVR